VLLIILWAIGLSMIALAGLIYLPMRVIAVVGVAIIVLHNLLDNVSAERFGRAAWIWDILYQRGVIGFDGIQFRPAYPVLPWIGVMAGGYCLGTVFDWDADRRRRLLVRLGLALAAAFVVIRAVNSELALLESALNEAHQLVCEFGLIGRGIRVRGYEHLKAEMGFGALAARHRSCLLKRRMFYDFLGALLVDYCSSRRSGVDHVSLAV
jgi:Heparan-alpha-glucosaminide N-acetyltransferase, catalytic